MIALASSSWLAVSWAVRRFDRLRVLKALSAHFSCIERLSYCGILVSMNPPHYHLWILLSITLPACRGSPIWKHRSRFTQFDFCYLIFIEFYIIKKWPFIHLGIFCWRAEFTVQSIMAKRRANYLHQCFWTFIYLFLDYGLLSQSRPRAYTN